MKRLVIPFLLMSGCAFAQDYTRIRSITRDINQIAVEHSDSVRQLRLNALWNSLITGNNVPLTDHDSVLFLYRGAGTQVAWRGDFNSWGYNAGNSFTGIHIPGTDLWMTKAAFPADARLDYKILINNTEWIIDPINPHQQWSGVGGGSPNSELRMPNWKPDPVSQLAPAIPQGKVERDILFNSKILNYQITYSIYYPSNYKQGNAYGVAYFTDGYEYLHERMGNLQVILDNLIAKQKIKPIIAVLVDHREPVNRSNNRRMQELALNEKYLSFFADELVQQVESRLQLAVTRNDRAIVGTSMGGLTAAYFAFARPGVFSMAGIQSPAFWFKPAIYTFCDQAVNPPVRIFLTTGTINDAREGSQKMKSILEKNTCTYQYTETNQGHSWGNWRDTVDDILVYFFSSEKN
ncbi:alpha/beta hydrolase-fold protein [Oscillatoria amoena NRMC-F 0135]|nr:alpha/beta hydrolase-fold protein [Oscillatoria amoena NRMC-F 0135]